MSIATSTVSSAIKKELGSFFSTDAHWDNDIIRYINSWVQKICIAKNFTFNKYNYLLTTIEWQTNYTIPYQIETFFILDEEWDEIEILDFENYYREKDKTTIIWIWDDKLVTEMKWTFNIFYRWFPDSITSLNSSIEIPNHFYDTLLVISTYFWFMDVKAYQKSWDKLNIFNWIIEDLATRNSTPHPLVKKRMAKSENDVW